MIRFLDDRVRIHFVNFDLDRMDVTADDLIRDAYFQDKLFKVVPELKYNFYQEMKEFNLAHGRLSKAGMSEKDSKKHHEYPEVTKGLRKEAGPHLRKAAARERTKQLFPETGRRDSRALQ